MSPHQSTCQSQSSSTHLKRTHGGTRGTVVFLLMIGLCPPKSTHYATRHTIPVSMLDSGQGCVTLLPCVGAWDYTYGPMPPTLEKLGRKSEKLVINWDETCASI